nr:MAG TPA: hypothetical protein [Caudoviricetes sp.]
MKKQPVPGGRERLRKNPHQFSIIPSNLRAKKRLPARLIPIRIK